MNVEIEKILPLEGAEDGSKIKANDYKQDGLWYCGTCHKNKQKRVKFFERDFTVWCLCDCEAEALEKKKLEIQKSEEMRAIERLRGASLMPGKFRHISFDDYRIRPDNEKAYRIATGYVKQFRQNEKSNTGLLLYGSVGTGKSFTAACIANALLEQKIPVVMTSFVKILQDIAPGSGIDEGTYINDLNNARLLIIDDLGAERSTDYALEKVYNVIDSRLRANRPIILTTNLQLDEMIKTEDIRFKRIYDRIFEVCLPVAMNGKSFRIERAAERQEAMNKFFDRMGANESDQIYDSGRAAR